MSPLTDQDLRTPTLPPFVKLKLVICSGNLSWVEWWIASISFHWFSKAGEWRPQSILGSSLTPPDVRKLSAILNIPQTGVVCGGHTQLVTGANFYQEGGSGGWWWWWWGGWDRLGLAQLAFNHLINQSVLNININWKIKLCRTVGLINIRQGVSN